MAGEFSLIVNISFIKVFVLSIRMAFGKQTASFIVYISHWSKERLAVWLSSQYLNQPVFVFGVCLFGESHCLHTWIRADPFSDNVRANG